MDAKHCSIEDCPGGIHSRGMCSKHYQRWRAHGDPTIVLPHSWGVGVGPGFRAPMDDWEKRHVARFLARGMSCRAIEKSTGICYMTVWRFSRQLREQSLAA